MIYITGDIHGEVWRIEDICNRYKTTKDDLLIILGDVGFNYYGDGRDKKNKKKAQKLPIRVFCIHGNHEARPELGKYEEVVWNGGIVYVEEAFPDIMFAKDGEIYDIEGNKTLVIGGAYSVDKHYRLMRGWSWWEDEQPSEEIKKRVEGRLEQVGWKVDVVLTHTIPLKYEPVEVFLPGIDQSTVDTSTEEWLDYIEDNLDYKKWYGGHFHTNKKVDKIRLMFTEVDRFME